MVGAEGFRFKYFHWEFCGICFTVVYCLSGLILEGYCWFCITGLEVVFSNNVLYFLVIMLQRSRSQWSRGLRRRSAAARMLRLWVRIPPGARMSVCCECCVLSGRGLCDGLITCPEESYRLWCVVVCDLDTS